MTGTMSRARGRWVPVHPNCAPGLVSPPVHWGLSLLTRGLYTDDSEKPDRSFSAAEGGKGILGRGNIMVTVRRLRVQSLLEPLFCCVTVGKLLALSGPQSHMLAPQLCRVNLWRLVQVKPHQTFSPACKASLPLSPPGKLAFISQTPAINHLPVAFLGVLPPHPANPVLPSDHRAGVLPVSSCLF